MGIAAIVIATLPQKQSDSLCPGHGQMAPKGGKPEIDTNNPVLKKMVILERVHSRHLPMVSQSIDNAVKALESDDKGTALAELNKAKRIMTGIIEIIANL